MKLLAALEPLAALQRNSEETPPAVCKGSSMAEGAVSALLDSDSAYEGLETSEPEITGLVEASRSSSGSRDPEPR